MTVPTRTLSREARVPHQPASGQPLSNRLPDARRNGEDTPEAMLSWEDASSTKATRPAAHAGRTCKQRL